MDGDINRKPPLFVRIISFVLFFSFGIFIKSYFFGNKESEKDLVLKQIDSINKTMPVVFDDFAKADSVSLLKNEQLKYSFTLIKIDDSSSKLYVDALKYKMKNQSQIYYETNEGMKAFRDNSIVVNYFYYDKNGKYLFDFSIKPNKK
ncbi:hypothetical protein [Flavobacterium terrisoli]|uniref:hypothetical protein n=1 Tax=Flavobacterium terrisoli TaxID=3242195 RepID=UPI0025434A5B|nr:hypothetical protein [Flavobacterium buctense]